MRIETSITCSNCGRQKYGSRAQRQIAAEGRPVGCSHECRSAIKLAETGGPQPFVCALGSCGKTFYDHPSQHRKYCCDEHAHLGRRRRVQRVCIGCGVAFETRPSVHRSYHDDACYEAALARLADARTELRDKLQDDADQAWAEHEIDRMPPAPGSIGDLELRSYCMGIFDGEGCITAGFSRTGKSARGRWSLMVVVTMAAPEVMQVLLRTWGGSTYIRKRVTAGGLILHSWLLTGSAAIPFLEYAIAHAIVKRRQAVIGLKIARSMAKYAGQRRAGYAPNNTKGLRAVSDEDWNQRAIWVQEIRALNGARSRFSGPTYEAPEGSLPLAREQVGLFDRPNIETVN